MFSLLNQVLFTFERTKLNCQFYSSSFYFVPQPKTFTYLLLCLMSSFFFPLSKCVLLVCIQKLLISPCLS